MVNIVGLNIAKREIEEIKEALKDKKIISEEDLINAREKLKNVSSKTK